MKEVSLGQVQIMGSFDEDMMDYFVQAGRMQGAEEPFLRVFAAIYMEPDDITLDELAKKTGYSPASVSNKVRALEASGHVIRTSKPGSKRIYARMEKDFLKLTKRHLVLQQEHLIGLAKAKLPEILKRHESSMRSEKDRKKLAIAREYLKQVDRAERIIPKMIELIDGKGE